MDEIILTRNLLPPTFFESSHKMLLLWGLALLRLVSLQGMCEPGLPPWTQDLGF